MKKLVLLIVVLSIVLSGCGAKNNEEKKESSTNAADVDESLFDVTITLPNSFFESFDTTAEEYVNSNEKNKERFKEVKLNDNGSVSVTMSKSDYKQMMSELEENIERSLQDVVNSEDYNVEAISHDSRFTRFEIKLNTNEVGFAESFLVVGFTMLGGIYQMFDGNEKPQLEVVFTNSSGQEIKTWDSDSLEN